MPKQIKSGILYRDGGGLRQGQEAQPLKAVGMGDLMTLAVFSPAPIQWWVGEGMFKTPAWDKEDFISPSLTYLSFKKSPLGEGRLRGLVSPVDGMAVERR